MRCIYKASFFYKCIVVCRQRSAMRCILVFVLACLTASHAYQGVGIFPPNQEIVYKYRSDVRSGTMEPALFGSQFVLKGNLHVQAGLNYTSVFMTDASFHVYNGEVLPKQKGGQDAHVVESQRIPAEAADIEKVFYVKYNIDGKVLGIETEKSDADWSVNIKKGIASLLQLDIDNIDIGKSHHHAFHSKESTLYGKCDVAYNVVPSTSDYVITKYQQPKDCIGYVGHRWYNVEPLGCDNMYEEPLSTNSRRKYHVVKSQDGLIINHIEAIGGVYIYPFKAHGEANYVLVNQTLEKYEIHAVKALKQITVEAVQHDLTYIAPKVDMSTGIIPDYSLGRKHFNMETMMPKMRNMLSEAADYLEENHLTVEEPDVKHGQTINRLMNILNLYDAKALEHCHHTLHDIKTPRDQVIMNLFMQILPHVGTRASLMFIKHLIVDKVVKDSVAISMIRMMPFNVRVPSEQLLAEMDFLVKFDDSVDIELRKVGVLSFGTLIFKTFQSGNHDSPILEQYVKLYYSRFTNAKDFPTQQLYLEGLHNIRVGNVYKYLEPVVQGNSDRHVRHLAMWASLVGAVSKGREYVYEVYWPIVSDRSLHLEIRIAALTIMMEVKPLTMDWFSNMYWFMLSETSEHFYHYYYTKLQTLSQTSNPCFHEEAKHAKHSLRFTKSPVHSDIVTEHHLYDYVDEQYGFGGMTETIIIGDEPTNTIQSVYVGLTYSMYGQPINYLSMFIKMEGLSPALTEKLYSIDWKNQKLSDVQTILKDVTTHHAGKHPVHFELIVLLHNHVVSTTYYSSDDIKSIQSSFMKKLSGDIDYYYQNIQYMVLGNTFLPTDMGVPAILSIEMPSVTTLKAKYHIDEFNWNNAHFKIQHSLRQWNHGVASLNVYNPINDLWHGIRRLYSMDISLPLDIDVAVNIQQMSLKWTVNRHSTDHGLSSTGLKSHVKTQVFIIGDDSDILSKSCPNCHHLTTVSKGDKYKRSSIIWEHDSKDTGLKTQIEIFDCERPANADQRADLFNYLLSTSNKNWGENSIEQLFLGVRNWYTYTYFSPPLGSCGFIMRTIPSTLYPASHIDVTLRMSMETIPQERWLMPGIKCNIRGTYNVKTTGEKLTRSWDMNSIIISTGGQIANDVDIQITRSTPGEKDLKLCVESEKQLVHGSFLSGKTNIWMGYTNDHKCVKDDTAVSILWRGEKSEEQKTLAHDTHHTYKECQKNPEWHSGVMPYKWECAMAQTSLRQYIYDVEYDNVPKEWYDIYYWFYNKFQTDNAAHIVHSHETPYFVSHNSMKIVVDYPLDQHVANIKMYNPHNAHEFSGVPLNSIMGAWMQNPGNTHFSKVFQWMKKIGLTKFCEVHHNVVHNGSNEVAFDAGSVWTSYASNTHKQHKWSVFAKKIDGHKPLALRLVIDDDNILEIIPDKHGDYVFTMSGSMVNAIETGNNPDPWYAYKLLQSGEYVMISMHHYGLYVEYDGQTIRVDVPFTLGTHLQGHCFQDHQ